MFCVKGIIVFLLFFIIYFLYNIKLLNYKFNNNM